MAGKWRQLAPHFLIMLVIYAIGVYAVWRFTDRTGFLVSLAIALAIAFVYPYVVRSLGLEPSVWRRETE